MMELTYSSIDWTMVDIVETKGASGYSKSQSYILGNTTIRLIEYSENYLADHWCDLEHIIYCIEGGFNLCFQSGKVELIAKGMSCIISSSAENKHQTSSRWGCKLFVVG